MEISKDSLLELGAMLSERKEQNIVLIAHTNPDGDAIGSSLAWAHALRKIGHKVDCIVPNKYPYFLDWISGIDEIIIHRTDEQRAIEALNGADILFFLDFNSTSRLENLGAEIDKNTTAKRVLIDHHLSPDENFDIMFSHADSSSTCFLVYSLIEKILGTEIIDKHIAEALYVGMMTDTGNFSFSFLTPELYRAVAVLAETGIDIPQINNNIYNSYSEDRSRLFGYAINRKMVIFQHGTVAHMSLTEQEMRRFNFQQGDNEGFVNYPLTIKKMKISAMFIEQRKFIRVSLRSRNNVDVNLFARRYFNGGGHKNAAGGKSYDTMEQTIKHFCNSIREFAKEGLLDV